MSASLKSRIRATSSRRPIDRRRAGLAASARRSMQLSSLRTGMDYADGHRERGFLAPYRRDEELRSSMVDSQGRSADPVQHSLRSSGNDTRRILLDAGLAMLEERGYAASRLADVAAAAGLTT